MVVPRPKRPILSSRMNSVREPAVFLLEKVRTEDGVVAETLVRRDAILEVEVAFPLASSFEKSSPAPMPFAAVDEAKWEMFNTSTTEALLESITEAESAEKLESEVVANMVKEPAPSDIKPPCPMFNPFLT